MNNENKNSSNDKWHILIDLDGVVADWVGGVKRLFEKTNPGKVLAPVSEFKNYYLQDDYPHWKNELSVTSHSKGLYSSLELIPGALEALKDIENNCLHFIEPFLCSTPDVKYEDQMCFTEKAAWVEKHLGSFWTERLILTQDKTVVFGDLLIDDKPDITGSIEHSWTQVLYAQSYNAHCGEPRFTWDEWDSFKNNFLLGGDEDESESKVSNNFSQRILTENLYAKT